MFYLNMHVGQGWSMHAEDLVRRGVGALQAKYPALCIEECLTARATEFVASYLARSRGKSFAFAAQRLADGDECPGEARKASAMAASCSRPHPAFAASN